MGDDRAEWALAAADVLATYESYQLLTTDRGFPIAKAKSVVESALTLLLAPGGSR
jgi:hypothetical protein